MKNFNPNVFSNKFLVRIFRLNFNCLFIIFFSINCFAQGDSLEDVISHIDIGVTSGGLESECLSPKEMYGIVIDPTGVIIQSKGDAPINIVINNGSETKIIGTIEIETFNNLSSNGEVWELKEEVEFFDCVPGQEFYMLSFNMLIGKSQTDLEKDDTELPGHTLEIFKVCCNTYMQQESSLEMRSNQELIDNSEHVDINFLLYNSNGQIISRWSKLNKFENNFANLGPGIYFLYKIEKGNYSLVEKICML